MDTKTKIGICVATVRQPRILEFLHAWEPFWSAATARDISVFVHEDHPRKELVPPVVKGVELHHTCHADIEQRLGARHWIIPRGSGASRSFPMYLAWAAGCEYIITLDDDCLPDDGGTFLDIHLGAFQRDRWFRTVDGEAVRGLPYRDRGQLPVILNHGLWRETPDLDGPTSLYHLRRPAQVVLPEGSQVVPPGMWFTLCAMNVCYRRDAILAAYNLLMGYEHYGVDRFDDIWSGLFLKRITDHLGLYIVSGEPFVRHTKASDPFINNRKEALGLELHELLWQEIAAVELSGRDMSSCYAELATLVREFAARCPASVPVRDYLERLALAMNTWLELFADGAGGGDIGC